jgi:hypothetical protein
MRMLQYSCARSDDRTSYSFPGAHRGVGYLLIESRIGAKVAVMTKSSVPCSSSTTDRLKPPCNTHRTPASIGRLIIIAVFARPIMYVTSHHFCH